MDVLPGEEDEDDEGAAGDEPEGGEEAAEAAHNPPASLLGQVAIVLLHQGLLLIADVPSELTDVQLEVLDVLHVFCLFFIIIISAVLTLYGAYQDSLSTQSGSKAMIPSLEISTIQNVFKMNYFHDY